MFEEDIFQYISRTTDDIFRISRCAEHANVMVTPGYIGPVEVTRETDSKETAMNVNIIKNYSFMNNRTYVLSSFVAVVVASRSVVGGSVSG